MAEKQINQFTTLAATPAADDWIPLYDLSGVGTRKLAASYLARSDGPSGNKLITGSGREATVPASGTVAMLGQAQTFTAAQQMLSLNIDGVWDIKTLANRLDFRNVAAGADRIRVYDDGQFYLPIGPLTIATTTEAGAVTVNGEIAIVDGMTAPATTAGFAIIYVDVADGDLKIKFGDGTVKTIATDT